MRKVLLFTGIVLFFVQMSFAQEQVSVGKAFVKNLVLPGWGFMEIDGGLSPRSRKFLASDMLILSTWFGLRTHNNALQNNLYAYANTRAGIQLSNADRVVLIAVGRYDNLDAYNAEQLRLRNWNQLLDNTPENQWAWESEQERARFNSMRDRQVRIDQQIPAVFSLLVINRLVSAVGAFKSARQKNAGPQTTQLTFVPNPMGGISSSLRVSF